MTATEQPDTETAASPAPRSAAAPPAPPSEAASPGTGVRPATHGPESRAAATAPAAPTAPAAARSPVVTEALSSVLKVAGAVVAPTTLLTGLLFYFGRQHAVALFGYLGVPLTVFDLTPQDYLVRSVDGLFVPLALTAGAVLALHWAYGWSARTLSSSARRLVGRRSVPALLLIGLASIVVAVVGARDIDAFATDPELPGLCLIVGVLLLAGVVHLGRSAGPVRRSSPAALVAEWGAVFVLVGIGSFWAVGNYASGVGRSRAVQIEHLLPATPDAVVYSEKPLGLHVRGVAEQACAADGAAYRYRYAGLKLIFQSGGQYLFLPAGWTRDEGPAIVIPRSDALRLEFSAPGRAQGGSC